MGRAKIKPHEFSFYCLPSTAAGEITEENDRQPLLPNVCMHCLSDLFQLNHPFTLLHHPFIFLLHFSETNLYLNYEHWDVSSFLFPCLPEIWILKYKAAKVLDSPISLFLVCLHMI